MPANALHLKEVDQRVHFLLDTGQPDQLVQLGQGFGQLIARWFFDDARFARAGRFQVALVAYGLNGVLNVAHGGAGLCIQRRCGQRHWTIERPRQLILQVHQLGGFLGHKATIDFRHHIGHAHHDRCQMRCFLTRGVVPAGKGPEQVVPAEFVGLLRYMPNALFETFALERLIPNVLEQQGRQFAFFGRPLPIGAGHFDKHFEQQPTMQFVHRGHPLRRLVAISGGLFGGKSRGLLLVQPPAIAQRATELTDQFGVVFVAWRHETVICGRDQRG